MSDQELKIIIEPSYKAGETLGTVTIKDCKFVDFECANYASLIAEVERLRADAEWLRESLLAYGRHLDHCGDSDAYNNAALESCGCGLDGILDQILAARGES